MSGVLQPPLRPAVRLWRIEHPSDGLGPFQGCVGYDGVATRPFLHCWLLDEEPNPDDMPRPSQDVLLRPRRGQAQGVVKFAFPSARALRRWFPVSVLHMLDQLGYQVALVSVPWEHHTRWEQQAAFDSAKAQVLRVLKPSDLLNAGC